MTARSVTSVDGPRRSPAADRRTAGPEALVQTPIAVFEGWSHGAAGYTVAQQFGDCISPAVFCPWVTIGRRA